MYDSDLLGGRRFLFAERGHLAPSIFTGKGQDVPMVGLRSILLWPSRTCGFAVHTWLAVGPNCKEGQ